MNLRKFKKDDELHLAQIIQNTWGYNRLSNNPEVALLMGKIYLYSCLASQNFHLVAELEDAPVGIIMGNSYSKKQADLSGYEQQLMQYYNDMMAYPEGKFILELFSGFEKLDKDMLAETGKRYDGELVFFVTDTAVRGKHIGTTLYNSLVDEFKKYNCKNIFVYTDASCNFGFYEHQGFVRVNKRIHAVHEHKMEFYVYDKEFI